MPTKNPTGVLRALCELTNVEDQAMNSKSLHKLFIYAPASGKLINRVARSSRAKADIALSSVFFLVAYPYPMLGLLIDSYADLVTVLETTWKRALVEFFWIQYQ
jgi:hypothetical protein